MIYLDYHASHPMLACVQESISRAVSDFGNPSSIHRSGQGVRRKIEDVREMIADNVGINDARVIFTSGATEANNLALKGYHVLCAQHEHPAVLSQVPKDQHIKVTPNGMIDLDDLEVRLNQYSGQTSVMVSTMLVNNETGIIQPIAQVSRLVHQYRGLLHVDAVQAAGRVKIDMREIGIDLLSLSAHKMGGPPGIGALVMPEALSPEPVIVGGGQERGRRGGTENWLGILGWGAALLWYQKNHHTLRTHVRTLDNHLALSLRDLDNVVWLGADYPRVMGCALLLCPEKDAQSLLIQLDLAGIAVSSGSACSSGRIGKSHVLEAMGLDDQLAQSALRVSYGLETTTDDLDTFVAQYRKAIGA